jgi:hypothetical protein
MKRNHDLINYQEGRGDIPNFQEGKGEKMSLVESSHQQGVLTDEEEEESLIHMKIHVELQAVNEDDDKLESFHHRGEGLEVCSGHWRS